MDILKELRLAGMFATVVYSALGMLIFAVAMMLINFFSPFSIRKEIEEDQNIALAVIIGSIFIALALIIQAAIRG